jgi:hypothetical protein
MTLWLVLTSLFRLCIMAIVVVKLTKYRQTFNCPERVGLGLAGGCALLTIPNIWQQHGSPFEGWAGTIFTLGFLVYLIGRMTRHFYSE